MTRTTPELAPSPLQTSALHQRKSFGHYVRFSVHLAPYTADLRWNRVSKLRSSSPEVETLPQRPPRHEAHVQSAVLTYETLYRIKQQIALICNLSLKSNQEFNPLCIGFTCNKIR
ncbi:hypothetical protein AVEN_181688-1 [Araneus ventricosus]|uniref:Uncharacterized protein n=1 Tax=Araneus ventricosus TaxID=182803 RepID=A0A4Y2MNX3_ARAVE|nr:hypothetical protein AVEN_181688-1 [Araneus ventricosus]